MDRYKFLDKDEENHLINEIKENTDWCPPQQGWGIRKTVNYLNRHGLLNLSEIRTACCNKKFHLNGIGMFHCSDVRGHSGNHRCVIERRREGDVMLEWPQLSEV